jgi:hypothetical protein
LEIPTDHALIAILYNIAELFGIKYILSGHNSMTESIGVPTWSQGHYDWHYVRAIQKKFGSPKFRKLKTYAHQGPWDVIWQKHMCRIKRVHILDYIDYDKKAVVDLLVKEFGFEEYRTKHAESVYTDFVQSYVLPRKFGYDKRKAHLSNLICAGQITRQDALDWLANPPLSDSETFNILLEVRTKLGVSEEEMQKLMSLPNRHFTDYPSYNNHPVYSKAKKVYKKIKR